MRSQAESPTIGIGCGHRVPREPIYDGRRKLYWCADCEVWRMSGGASTGEHGNAYLHLLAEVIEQHPVAITVADPGTERGRATIAALGAEIVGPERDVDEAYEFFLEAQERALRIEQGEQAR